MLIELSGASDDALVVAALLWRVFYSLLTLPLGAITLGRFRKATPTLLPRETVKTTLRKPFVRRSSFHGGLRAKPLATAHRQLDRLTLSVAGRCSAVRRRIWSRLGWNTNPCSPATKVSNEDAVSAWLAGIDETTVWPNCRFFVACRALSRTRTGDPPL